MISFRLYSWSINRRVSRQFGTQQFIHQERQKILNEFLTVWTKGTLYPTPGSDTLRLPFQFQLPVDIPPSFQFNANYKHGIVGYYIDVVGVRKGAFSSNRRIYKPFAVVRHDPASASIRAALQNGWTGDWDVTERVAKIRRGLWGEHADVRMEVRPNMSTLVDISY